jgi:16S rRNA (cytidine1402-2'-O)-methyltransferase
MKLYQNRAMKKAPTPAQKGILYIIATPIGNLADISFRAIEMLKAADLIAAEDTRHAQTLLNAYRIKTPLTAYHEHNEQKASAVLIRHLAAGHSLAVISDAGTPLINDPGFPLVRKAKDEGFEVVPIPGCCALIAALSVSGLATDRFSFEGFPPRKASARRSWLEKLLDTPRTSIFYESNHRIKACLHDICAVFPSKRRIVIARELTKLHETIIETIIQDIDAAVENDPYIEKGELVVLLEGAPPAKESQETLAPEQERMLSILLQECSVKTAVSIAVKITALPRKTIYRAALRLRGTNGRD